MALILLNWVFVWFVCFSVGYLGVRGLSLAFNEKPAANLSGVLVFLLGLALVTTMGNYVSLFFPIGGASTIFLLALSLAVVLRFHGSIRKDLSNRFLVFRSRHWIVMAMMGMAVVIALVKAAGPVDNPDEGQYYLPLVRWIESYAVVPGTGHFLDRIGYNSAIHMTNALFGQAWLVRGGMYDINGLLFILLFFHFFGRLDSVLFKGHEPDLSVFFTTAGMIFLFRAYLTSMDSDFSHSFIGLLVFSKLVDKAEKGKLFQWDMETGILSMLVFLLVTIKFLAIFFLTFVLFGCFRLLKDRRFASLVWIIALGCIVAFPWMMRNYYITGYLVYPVSQVDLFAPDWKIPKEIAKANQIYVSEFAKTMNDRHTYNFEGARELKLNEWLPAWVEGEIDYLIGKVVILGLPSSLLVLVVMLLLKGGDIVRHYDQILIILGVVIVYLVFWFFRYPAIRFSWSWILVCIMLPVGLFVRTFMPQLQKLFLMGLGSLVFLSMVRGVVDSVRTVPSFRDILVSPVPSEELNDFHTIRIDSATVIVSHEQYCKGANPPCLPGFYPADLEMRGKRIQDGFRIKKQRD